MLSAGAPRRRSASCGSAAGGCRGPPHRPGSAAGAGTKKDLPALRYQGHQVFEPRAAGRELKPEPEPANPFEATSEWDPSREEGWDEEPAAGDGEHGDDERP